MVMGEIGHQWLKANARETECRNQDANGQSWLQFKPRPPNQVED